MGVIFDAFCLFVVCIVATAAAIPYKELKPNYETVVHATVFLHPQGTNYSQAVDMTYFKNNVWIMEGSSGSVDIHDFNTGLHFVRKNQTAPCFVYPTYHKFEDGTKLMNALEGGLREIVDVDIAWVVPLSDNLIRDARFAPVESANYCDRYQWAYIDHYIISHIKYAGRAKRNVLSDTFNREDGGCTSNCALNCH